MKLQYYYYAGIFHCLHLCMSHNQLPILLIKMMLWPCHYYTTGLTKPNYPNNLCNFTFVIYSILFHLKHHLKYY